MPSLARRWINWQLSLSNRFDRILPDFYRIDGNTDYERHIVPRYLRPGLRIYDIGGGKNPLITPEKKTQLGVTVIGIDFDQRELDRAPAGLYDEAICADITTFRGAGDADLVISRTVLEHVANVEDAFAGIASILKPGGIAVVFVPSRNAVYARINRLLPQPAKRALLYAIFPYAERDQGFPAVYDRCTPGDFERIAEQNGLDVVERTLYFASGYFAFLFPAYVVWRAWTLAFHALAGNQAAETFAMVFRRSAASG